MTTPQTTGNNDTLPPSLRAFANENADGNIELFGTTAGLPEGAEVNVLITDDQGNSTTATATVTANSFSLPNIWAGMFTSGNVQIYISSGAVSDQVELPLSGNHLQEPVTITSAEFDANGLIDAAGTAPALLPGTVLSVIVRDQNDASVTATATVGADGTFSVQDVSTQGLSAGTLTFDVLAQDSNGMLSLLNVATLELSNDVPLGADATLTATEDQDYVLSASDFGYVAAQGRVLTGVKVAALPAPGTLKLNGVDVVVDQVISKADLDDGKLVFKSALDGNGSNYAKFKFKVQDSRANNNEDPIANTLTFNVTAENDPAIIAGDLTGSLTETNAVESMTGTLSITDVDSPLTFAAQTDTAGTGGYGKFSLTTAGVWTYTMNSAQNQFVAGQSYIDKFTAVSSDGTSKEVTVTITGTNDAPVLADTSLAIAAVLQGSGVTPTGVKGILVSDLVGGITDADTGAAKGIAITGVNTAKGQLYYSLDGGTNWTELTDATLSTARLLKADADNRIYFKPAAGTLGDVTDAITFRAWDTTTGTDGQTGNASVNDGTTAFSKDSDTVSEYVVAPVTINAVSVDNLVNGSEPLVITGKADPNAVVTLNINGQTTNVTAGPTGDWSFDGSKVRYVMVRKTLQNLAENNADFNTNGVMTVGDVSVMSGGVNVALNAVQSTSNRAAFLYTNGNYYDQSLHDGTADTFAEAYGFAVPGGAGGDVWVQLDLGGWYSVDSIDVQARASLGGRLNGTKVYASPNDMSGLTQAQLDASWIVSTANTITGLATASSGTYSVVSPVAVPASVLAEGDNVITASELVRGVSSQATATVTLDILAPTTTVLTAALSNDNGTSSTDFITTVAAQTISGTLSANLAADEKVMVSMDNGTTWVQASATVGTSTWTLPGVTLSGSNTMLAKVVDTAGNGGAPYSHTYAHVPVSNLTVGITQIDDNAGTASTVLSGGTSNDTTPTLVGTLGGATQGAALGTNEVVNVYRTPNLAVATVVQAETLAGGQILSGNALTQYINAEYNYGDGKMYLPTTPANGDMVVVTKGASWGLEVYAGTTLISNVGGAGYASGGQDNLYFKWDAAKGTWLTGTNAMVKVGTATVTTNAAGQSTWTLTDNSGLGNSDSVLYVAQVENTTGTFGQQSTPGAFDWRYTVDNVAPQAVADEVTGNEDTASLTGTVASNDTSKDGTEAYTLEGSSNGTLAGTHGTLQLNPNGSYTYTRTANLDAISATATDTFTYKVTDGVGNSTTATLTVKMDPVNDAPVLTTGSTLAYTENGAAAAINTAITVADVDNATLKSATVTISGGYVSGQDTLSFTNVPATMGDIAGVLSGATMTLTSASGTATKAQWQTALRAVAYNNTSDNPTTAARTVSFVINDGTGTATASSAAVTSTINLTAVNDPATIGGPVLKTLTESDVVQTATGTLTIADPDSPLTFVQQIDTVGTGGYGKFSITTAGVWTYTMDNAHNEFVDAQVYTDTFTVSSADGTMQVITVKITGTNDSAAITGINTATITQNTVAQTVSDTLLISDVDSPTTFVAQTNTPGENNYGKFSLTTAGVWTYTMNSAQTQLVGGTSYTDSFTATSADGTTKKVTVTINGTNDAAVIAGDLTKSLTETNAVESVTGTLSITDPDSPLTFAAQTNTPGTAGYGKFSLTTAGVWTYTMNSAQNQFVAGQTYIDKFTAVSSDGTSKEVTVTITGTNDAPVLADTSLAIAAVLQGSGVTPTGVKGILVSDLVGGITDADTGAAKGIAITGVNSAKGQLYYSLDGGTNWTELTDATLSTARLLKADADNRIYFKPAAGTLGDVTDAITFRAWDTTTGTDGQTGNASVNDGTTAFSKDSDTVSEYVVAPVTINAVSVDNLIGAKEPVIFTGKADPNAVVTLNINGQAATATADGAGNWTYDASKVRYIMVRKSLMNLASSDPEYNLKGIFTVGEVEIYERTSGENIGRWGAVTQTYSNASQFTTGSLGDGNSYYAAGRYVETSGSQMGLAAGVSQDAWVQIDLGGTYALRDIKLVSAENQGARMNGATIYTSMTNMSSLTREQLDASPLVNSSTPVSGVSNAGWQGSWASASAINGSPLSEGANTITASELVRGVSSQATATVTLDATVPQAVADEVTGNEDTASLTGTVASNDTNKDGSEVFTLEGSSNGTLVGTHGTLQLNPNGTYTYTRTANLDAISATATDTFTYKVTDAAGNSTTATLTVKMDPVNDAAVIAGDLTKSMTETNAVQSTTGTLSITDVDSPLTFAAQTDTAGTGGYGKFSLTTAGVWTYTLNTAHDEFEAGQNYTDKFTVVSSDGTSKEVSVTIAGTNDAPTLSSSSTAFSSFTENGGAVSAKSGTITLSDVDSANLQGATVSVVDFVDGSTFYTGDVLTWTVPSGASITGNYNTSTGVLNFTGTATKAQYEQLLNSVMFNNLREDLAGGARKVYWSVTDTSGQASAAGPYSTVSVNKLNDAPVLANTALSLTAVQPATADVAPVGALGVLVSSLVGGVTDADGTAVTKGIAIIAANEALGKVYFSVNGGTNWYSPGFALASTSALLLKADANTRVYFRPNVGVEGEIADALTIRAWDATDNKPTINGTNVYQYNIATTGGVTPFSSATDTVSLSVASTASAGFAGTAGNDVMTGTAANEVMVGGGGADQINGGGGNDKIVLNADNVTQLSAANSANINGGSGINTLKLTGESMMLDLSNVTVQGKVDNFSTVDITGNGNNTLKLNLLNVQTLSGATDNAATTDVNEAQMLVVQGNAGDAVVLENTASWATLVGLTGSSLSALYGADYGFVGTHKYTQYSKNGASVFVDELTPVADIVGTSGDNVLTGTAGADVLFGNGGADQISAGTGNDTVVLNASGLNALSVANTASLNGDAGVNVLKLSGTNMMLDLTNITVQAKVSNFSVLDLRQGNANKVKLNLQEVLDLSGGTDNAATVGVDESQMLVVQGNGGAQVNAVQLVGGLTWTAVTNLGGTTLQNTYGAQYGFEVGHSYTQYTSGSANLFVDQSLIQTML